MKIDTIITLILILIGMFLLLNKFTKVICIPSLHTLSILSKGSVLTAEVEALTKRVEQLEKDIKALKNSYIYIPVSVSAYNPTRDQCDSTPFITASNQRVRKGIVALSRDLEKEFGLKFGDKVHLLGIGTFVFADRMHRRWKRREDLFMFSRKKAKIFGRQKTIMVIKG